MAVLAKDTFTRANNAATMGNTDTGQPWEFHVPQVWGIQNNQAYAVTPAYDDCIYVNAGRGDGVAFEVRFTEYMSSTRQTMWRIMPSGRNFFCLQGSVVYRAVNDVWVSMGSIGTVSVGNLLRVELVGSEHKIFINGALRLTFTDPAHLAATRFGFSTSTTTVRFDDFLVESIGDDVAPGVTILSASRAKVSSVAGMNSSVLTLKFNEAVTAWKINLNGVSHNTGTTVESGGAVNANTEFQAIIYHTDLNTEGQNRLNIYGCDAAGNWTPYQS